MTTLTRHAARPLALVSLCALSACATMKVSGRVVPGTISHVGIVDQSDDRLGASGLGGIEVTILPTPGNGPGIIARATTDKRGEFKANIPTRNWPTDRVQIRATGEGYAAARGTVYLPRDGQKLLILMERTVGD